MKNFFTLLGIQHAFFDSLSSRLRSAFVNCKRFFIAAFAVTLLASPAMAASYTITFNTASTDGSVAISASTGVSTVISAGTDYVSGFTSSCSKAYYNGKNGVKVGSKSSAGTLEFTIASAYQANIKKITVKSAVYGTDAGTLSLSANSTELKSEITPGTDYTYTFGTATTVTTITLETSEKRAYVSEIILETAPSGTDPVSGVSLDQSSLALTVGETATLTETVAPSTAADKSVSWSSSNTSVATVDANGVVTAIAAGSAIITVTTTDGGKTATCNVTVSNVAVTGVTVAPTSASLTVGATQQLTATIAPTNATDKVITWTSSDNSKATVDANGLVTAMSAGSATITATTHDGGIIATCVLTIAAAPCDVTIDQNKISDFTNSYNTYTWSNNGVTGDLYAYKASGMQLNADKVYHHIRNTTPLPNSITSVTMKKASGTSRTWSLYVSNSVIDPDVDGDEVLVDSKEVSSTTTWTVTGDYTYFYLSVSGGSTVIDSVVVEYACGPSLKLTPSTLTATRPNVGTASLTATPNSFTPTTYTWTTSDPNVASVSGSGASATVTYLNAGTCTITCSATDGTTTQDAVCPVTVPQTYSLSLVEDGVTTVVGSDYLSGDTYTLPAGSSSCDEYTFFGWTDAIYTEGTTTKPTSIFAAGSSYTMPAAATTLYAVYGLPDKTSDPTFKVATLSDITDGQTVVIRSAYAISSNYYSLNKDVTATAYSAVLTSSSRGVVVSSNQKWTAVVSGDEYAFYNGSEYLAASGTSSNSALSTQASLANWSLVASTDASYTGCLKMTYNEASTLGAEYYSGSWQLYASTAVACNLWFLVPDGGYSQNTYTTAPTCGPTIRANGEPYITSSKDITIQAADSISVVGSTLGTATTLSVASSNAHFTAILSNTTIADGKIKAKLAIKYTPVVYNTIETATITLSAAGSGATPVVLTVHGRSLPESFVIVTRDVNNVWKALPSNMPKQDSYLGISIKLDSDADPTVANKTYEYTHYSLLGVYADRATTSPQLVRLSGTDDKCLFGPATGNYIYNGSIPSTAKEQYEWLLTTTDNVNYTIYSANNKHYLRTYSSNHIGLYASGNDVFRILPYIDECVYFAPPTNITYKPKAWTASISCDTVPHATQYEYKVGSATTWTVATDVVISGARATFTVSGLTSGSANTITIRGNAPANAMERCDENLGTSFSLTTTTCDDVPEIIGVTPTADRVTFAWTASAKKANILVYSDAACTSLVASASNVSSPYTLTGLTEATQYYYIIASVDGITPGGCKTDVLDFMTNNPAISVATWHEDGIDVFVNASGTPAILVTGEKEHGTKGGGNIADDLFFSKYFEATSNVKLLAIYNGTDHDIPLKDYSIKWSDTGHTTSSGTATWAHTFDFDGATDHNGDPLPDTLYQSKEIILITYQYKSTPDNDAAVIKCAQDDEEHSHFSEYYQISGLNFSGNDAISLYRYDTITKVTSMIDIIGAGDESTVQLDSLKNTYDFQDDPGWVTQDGESVDGVKPFTLSSNRCLLIRKNTVKSGYNSTNQGPNNAVDLNKKDFVTLGGTYGEWMGHTVPDTTDTGVKDKGVQASCEGFAYVGSYNYSDYYTTYEAISDTTDLDGKARNVDGTITVPIPDLYKMSCSNMKVILFADTTCKVKLAENPYTVPIIVFDGNKTNSDTLFTRQGVEVCKTCNVVVTPGSTFSMNHGNDSILRVGDVTVYEKARIDLTDKDRPLTVKSLSIRARQDSVGSAYFSSSITLPLRDTLGNKPMVYFTKFISDADWHFITVPYPVNIRDITFTDNTPCQYRKDFFLKWYDGAYRAEHKTGGWTVVDTASVKTLMPGVGYIVAIVDQSDGKWKELRFPMVGYDEISGKNVPVTNYGEQYLDYNSDKENGRTPNHKGWNLVGNPYLAYYEKGHIADIPIFIGGLTPTILDDGTNSYERNGNALRYITIPDNLGRSGYHQVLASSIDLPPFTSYFVQIGVTDGTVTALVRSDYQVGFTTENRSSVLKAPAFNNESENEMVYVGVRMANTLGETDETSLAISNNCALVNYDMCSDLAKWKGTSYKKLTKPVLYSIVNGSEERAFNALTEQEATNLIPLGYYAAKAGVYTISLNRDYDLSLVESVTLYDAVENLYTNLLLESYEFSTDASSDNTSRLFLSVKLKQKPDVATGILNQTIGTDKVIKFVTPDGCLHIAIDGVIYDVVGRKEERK